MLGTLRKNLSLSSVGQTFQQPAHWTLPLGSLMSWSPRVGREEKIETDFASIVTKAYKQNGPVFACVLARALPFSEARFMWQELVDGRPGRLTGSDGLELLQSPWPNATTGELLWRMEQDASLAGNFYATTVQRSGVECIRRLRPDWLTIISGINGDPSGSSFALDSEVLGYIYHPRNVTPAVNPQFLSPDRVVHYSPVPDPEAQWRGMSWLTPVLDEIAGDKAATKHKLKFFDNGATSNLVVTYDASVNPEAVERYAEMFDQAHAGVDRAYSTIHLGGGADAKAFGADMKQIDFKATQGAGETRIAAAAGVGAIMARLSEGLQGSSLNDGNYNAAKRHFADMTLRPLWRMAAGSLTKFAEGADPKSKRLWYDVTDVEFLKDDRKDQSEVLNQQATTIASLVAAGYQPDAVIDAVDANDLSRLSGKHSGLYSVQLQAPGTRVPPK